MKMKRVVQNLVSMEELRNLMEYSSSLEIERAKEIADSWQHRGGANWELRTGDWRWDFACMLSSVYLAGRVQGIREERSRRRQPRKCAV